jgi:hypothetical protein
MRSDAFRARLQLKVEALMRGALRQRVEAAGVTGVAEEK